MTSCNTWCTRELLKKTQDRASPISRGPCQWGPRSASTGRAGCAASRNTCHVVSVQVSELRFMTTRRLLGSLILSAAIVVCAPPNSAEVPKPAKPSNPANAPADTPAEEAHELTSGDAEAFLDGAVPLGLAREDIAGAVLVVVKDGRVLVSKGYGFRDVKNRQPVLPDATLFRPGSISKTFTWTAVMQLVERGKLDLDRDVNDYLDFEVPHSFGRPVTLRNLMTHTPGFEEVIKDLMADRADQLPSLGAFVRAHRPNQIYRPGTVPAYSNYGADLAGYIVERVSGAPFEQYVETNIFRPLGITRASFSQPLPAPLQAMMSNGYELASEEAKPFELVPPKAAPDGSLSITGEGMARFMIAHLQDGRFGEARILEAKTAQMMHARQFAMDSEVNGMALGFYEESRNGLRIIGHGGDLNYFHSDMHLIPERGVGFFVSYNSAGKGEVEERTQLWQKFLDRYFPLAKPATDAAAAKEEVELPTGKYLSSRRAETTILKSLWLGLAEASVSKAGDGTIEVDQIKDFNGRPKRWRSVGNMRFREAGGQQLLVFERDASGRLQMITEDPIETFQRVTWSQSKTVLALGLGFVVLWFASTVVLWPVGACVRRHYGVKLALSPVERRWRLFVKIWCLIDLLALAAFAAILGYGFSHLSLFGDRLDPWLRVLQAAFAAALAGTLAIVYASYKLWRTSPKGIWGAAYAAGLVLACSIFGWFVLSSRILSTSLKY